MSEATFQKPCAIFSEIIVVDIAFSSRNILFTEIFSARELLFGNIQRAEKCHDKYDVKYMEIEHSLSLCTKNFMARVRVTIPIRFPHD